jgi:putative flippase GtrA
MSEHASLSGNRPLHPFAQFMLFSGIGVFGTSAHYALLYSLVQWAHAAPVAATTAGFVAGAIINYALNYRYTFKSRKRHSEAALKFLLVATAGAVLNASVMQIGITKSSIDYMLVQLLATGIVLVWNFLANRLWTFSEPATQYNRDV